MCLIHSSATPIKLFNGVANLISPFKENQGLYNNSPMKINMDFANPLGSKKIFIYKLIIFLWYRCIFFCKKVLFIRGEI